jgi:hypothetical protein
LRLQEFDLQIFERLLGYSKELLKPLDDARELP